MENKQYGPPIYVDWKFNRIIEMLREIPGYENIILEFKFVEIDSFRQIGEYDVTGGIKEGTNWILKYHRKFLHNDKTEARVLAITEIEEQIIKSVWMTAINSFKNQTIGH
jgi:hypothetical protein